MSKRLKSTVLNRILPDFLKHFTNSSVLSYFSIQFCEIKAFALQLFFK